jgi:hypothetical protein
VVFKKMQCEKCSYTGPEGEDHYHINVEHGVVTEVWFVSGNGCWDRDLEKDEWFVEYSDDSIKTRVIKTIQAVKIPKPWNTGKPANDEWIKPTLYKGYHPEPSLIEKMVSSVKRLFR